jgi:putative membrane protein
MMWPWFNWGLGGFVWIMPVMMAVFWGLIIWGFVVLVRGVSRRGCCSSDQAVSALDILKRRYASGEISKEEFEEKKRAIA